MKLAAIPAAAALLNVAIAASISEHGSKACSSIKAPSIPGAKITSIKGTERLNFTVFKDPLFLPLDIPNLSVCDIEITLTHPGAGDNVTVQIWLPLDTWNHRFTAAGGSGWAAGLGQYSLAPLVVQGYATAVTDAGLSGNPYSPTDWALRKNGQVNVELLLNFASRSIHDLAVAGKAVTAAFYGTAAKYSYWNGCSTGGRQGMVAAQQFPNDFDGLLAAAPAIHWPRYVVAEQWPQVVMQEANVFPSPCELTAVTQAAIDACDTIDGVKDGVITEVDKCKFDPAKAVGLKVQCDGAEKTITSGIASVVRKIWDGQKAPSGEPLWHGLNKGAPLDYLANTTLTPQGNRVGFPFFVNDGWIRYFVEANPNFNLSSVGTTDLAKIFFESQQKFGKIMGSDNPDLSGLRRSDAKLLVWQGEADQLIFPQGTIEYRNQVAQRMGGAINVDEFFRLFIAPGVDHCGLGTTPGAVPTDPFGALRAWVEQGKAPTELIASTLPGAKSPFTRKICLYPLVAKYRGRGDPSSSDSYECQKSC